MSTYTAGFKARMLQRMVGPESISATALANEVGVLLDGMLSGYPSVMPSSAPTAP